MVFHGGQPSGKKKAIIGRRQKQGNTFRVYQQAILNAEAVAAPEDEADHPNTAVEPMEGPPLPPSNKRKDDNWRTSRAVKSAKKSQQKAVAQRNFVMETNTIIQGKLDEAAGKVKALERERFFERKASRAVAIKTAEEHKFAISELSGGFDEDIQAAYALADAESSRCLEEEERRIKDEQSNLAMLQSQQHLFDSKLQKIKADHLQQLQKERHHFVGKLENESGRLEKERHGQEAVVSHLHATWQKRMEYNTDKKDEKMMADRVQNEERYVFSFHSFFMTKSHSFCSKFVYHYHFHRVNEMKSQLDSKSDKILEEKNKRRAGIADEIAKRKAVEQTVDELYGWIHELHSEIETARLVTRAAGKEVKAAKKDKLKLESIASNRLIMLRDLKFRFNEAKDQLADESYQREALECMNTIKLEIKKERVIGRRGGGSKWPVHIVLLICELLVNSTPPSAVPANIQTMSAAMTGAEAEELPAVNFVRQCRTVLQNLNETLAALRLGKADTWHQLFTDGTSRRQIAFQNLVIALMEDGKLDPVIVSSCMVLEDETSEKQVKSIVDMVSL